MIDLAHLTINSVAIFGSLSRSLLRYLSLHDPILTIPPSRHPHQALRLNPFTANPVVAQTQCCQGRVLLQPLGQCLTEDKAVKRNMVNSVNPNTRKLTTIQTIWKVEKQSKQAESQDSRIRRMKIQLREKVSRKKLQARKMFGKSQNAMLFQ